MQVSLGTAFAVLMLLLLLLIPGASAEAAAQTDTAAQFDRSEALALSQAAIGRDLSEPMFQQVFYDTNGQARQLSDYAGKPLVISLIFTSCHHICPATTQHLAKVVRKARDVLGDESFSVITIGFDTVNDTADAMRSFARRQNVDIEGWDFLSTDQRSVDTLASELGFQYFPTANGFDHLIQSSIIDAEGTVFRQVYGIRFDTPHLIEPLKVLVFEEDPNQSFFAQITSKIKLFCTVYDPASDSYTFDYSIFVGLGMGLSLGGIFLFLLIREWRRSGSRFRKTTYGRSQ